METSTLNNWRTLIKQLLKDLVDIPYGVKVDLSKIAVFDDKSDSYLIVVQGWEGPRRLHGCLVHLEIIDGKFWIQQDGTEYGIATDLLAAGIAKDDIVLGFKEPSSRKHTGFAVA
jgi:hypothetical protein